MSRLREMIKELCPDGVEYKKLGEILSRHKGIAITAGRMKELHTSDGEIRIFAAGNTYADVMASDIDWDGIIREPAIIVKSRGNIGFEYYTQPFSHKNEMWSYTANRTATSLKYVYYVLEQNVTYFQNKAKTGKLPQISISDTENYEIPIPPLAIQNEIVKLLDNFTELTAELTAELQLRKKQYSFYRDSLLNFSQDNTEVEWKTLGEMCRLKAGTAISALNISTNATADSAVPCYGGNGLRGYVRQANQSEDAPLIGRQGALCGNVCYATAPYYATEHAVVVDGLGHFDNRFLFHILRNMNLSQYKTAGAQPGLSVKRLNQVHIAVPTIEAQKRIADVLDRFDTLTSDLTQGLPAEIAARKKQYEYYRDKLLTFPRKGA